MVAWQQLLLDTLHAANDCTSMLNQLCTHVTCLYICCIMFYVYVKLISKAWMYMVIRASCYAHRCSQLSTRQLLFLTQQLAGVAKQEAGQSMLHIIVAALADMLEALPVEPPYPTIGPPPGARQATSDSAKQIPAIAPAVIHAGDASQHRQRGGNRRLPNVREQQIESRQLQQQQEALLAQPAHASMRQARQKLPAFSKRKDLLTKLSQHSVIVISGATGMTCSDSHRS